MPRTARPNVIYAPFRCFAPTIRMLPYPPKEASGRRLRGIGTRDRRHSLDFARFHQAKRLKEFLILNREATILNSKFLTLNSKISHLSRHRWKSLRTKDFWHVRGCLHPSHIPPMMPQVVRDINLHKSVINLSRILRTLFRCGTHEVCMRGDGRDKGGM